MSQYQNDAAEQAALELFAKQASAEGIDLEQLNDDQVEAAFSHFVENILPEMLGEEVGEEVEYGVEDKIAAAQNAIAFDAFTKAAAAEGVDLNELSEDDVAELFGAWLVQDVPQLFEEQAKEAELLEYAKIAEANLSEMTVMGQHLGEVAADAFLAKVAASASAPTERMNPLVHVPGGRNFRERAGEAMRNLGARGKAQAARAFQYAKAHPGQAAGAAAVGLGTLGASVYGLKKLRDSRQEKETTASAIDERVLEILSAHGLID